MPDSLYDPTKSQRCNSINRHGVHCENTGVPEDGFDFFFCGDCSAYLEECSQKVADKANARHANN